MAEVKWIKLYVDMFKHEKIKFIRNLPEGSDILLVWIMLLLNAGRCNANGYIFLTENIPYTPEILAGEFDLPLNTIRLALETLERLNMINLDEVGIYISNWEKYQNTDKLESIREYNRLAKQRQREKDKAKHLRLKEGTMSRTSQGQVKECHETDVLDLDLDKEKEKGSSFASPLEIEILSILRSVKNYPFDYDNDLNMIRTLTLDFPQVNILQETKRRQVHGYSFAIG